MLIGPYHVTEEGVIMGSQAGIVRALRHGLIVSCQADMGDPLYSSSIMAAMAASAVLGGAVAIRARGVDDIRAIKAAVQVPVIGLTKRHYPHSPVYITPTWEDVAACLHVGADIVAIDATDRVRPDGLPLTEIIHRAHATSSSLLMADVATASDGKIAAELGFDFVSTTLAGYTAAAPPTEGPDLALVSTLANQGHVPVIAEGRITTPEQAAEALRRGAWAICVGKAITAPRFIAGRFARALHDNAGG